MITKIFLDDQEVKDISIDGESVQSVSVEGFTWHNLNALPTNGVITGAYALAIWNIISFVPNKITLEMPTGTNTSSKFYENYNITTQSKETLDLGIDRSKDYRIYSLERLFIEFDKFPMENTIKAEAIKKLEARCNPHIVRNLYLKLKNKRRGIDKERIEKYLSLKHEDIIEALMSTPELNRKDIMREYLISRVSDLNIPVLIKGGSSIELFSEVKRSTFDVDAHTGIGSLEQVLASLANSSYEIWFELTEESKTQITKESKVYKLKLIPKSRRTAIAEYFKNVDLKMEISFNVAFTTEELEAIIKDFQLSKTRLRYLRNQTCMPFSREMLLAEKFQSLISKPEHSSRTKDLIDLAFLWRDDFNHQDFVKWFFRKFERQRHAQSKAEAIQTVKDNRNKELIKIKDNFEDALKFYGFKIDYQDCINKYNTLADVIIKEA